MTSIPDLTTRVGLLEHRVEAIRAALEESTLRGDVQMLLHEHLAVAEEALTAARRSIAAGAESTAA